MPMKIDGKREAFTEFMGLLDVFPFRFNSDAMSG
jgi:hypothetical protein